MSGLAPLSSWHILALHNLIFEFFEKEKHANNMKYQRQRGLADLIEKSLLFWSFFAAFSDNVTIELYYGLVLWLSLCIFLFTLVVEFLFLFLKLYYLKSYRNKKGLIFVGMLVLFILFFAAGSWLKFWKKDSKNKHPYKR